MTNEELYNYIRTLESKIDTLISLQSSNVSMTLAQQQPDCDRSLFAWLDEWYDTYKAPKLSVGGLRQIRTCIDNHLKKHLADIPLNRLDGLDIQKALNAIKQSRTRKYTYNVINAALKQATKLRIINNNPMQAVDTPQHKYNNGEALTHEQQQQFAYAIKNTKQKSLFEFYILSGCRRGEALGITWEDVDFDKKLIHIRGTKTDGSDRYIPLFPEIAKIFKKLPKETATVFNTTANAVNCCFKRLKKTYGFTFKLHDLRHTFATRCLENGISMKLIQKWLGHSRLDTTANIYTHVQTEFEQEQIAKYNPSV